MMCPPGRLSVRLEKMDDSAPEPDKRWNTEG